MRNKKEQLDKLYYNIGNQQYDFFLCGTWRKGDETMFSKWKKYSECVFPIDFDGTSDDWKEQKFFEQINQRQILPCEIILDLEDKNQLKPIFDKLSSWVEVKDFKIYSTGSRGYHIHILLKEDMNEEDKLKIIKYFKADEQKASAKTMIALENTPHWKSGKNKHEVKL